MAHEALQELYQLGAAETDKPWERWEVNDEDVEDGDWLTLTNHPLWLTRGRYRRKPGLVPPSGVVKSILDEARDIIYGDRESTYGDPGKNLRTIGDLWSTWLNARHGVSIELSATDVCDLMTLLKVARLANTPEHRDSRVDTCGYQALAERVTK